MSAGNANNLMGAPTVSILIPMLNARAYVRQAIESVLGQRGVNMEIIIVDDGSTDDSAEIVKSIRDQRVRLISGPRGGVAAAFNAALQIAAGDFVGRCDADDLFSPDRLEWQLSWLKSHPEFGAICGGFATLMPNGDFIRDLQCGTEAHEITNELRDGQTRTSLCTWLVQTELVRRLDGCREFFKSAEDIDLQLRLAEICRVWFEPRQCYLYRLHGASATHTRSSHLRRFYDRTARQLQQQRRQGLLDDLQQDNPPALPEINGELSQAQGSRQHIQGMLLGAAWDQHAAGRRGKALRTALRACLTLPSNLQAWKSLGVLAIRGQRD